ncbi:TPA: hypothetical protein ACWQBQ_003868 [Escherichia coli]|nr:hypothetical protein [Escherichia coli]MCV8267636.1 hypothetical protein [Escherichia coli]MCV8308634.1 hypothetical protein [Escherichia coli]MCV8317551.1 hypothetical protein [Escherichia coli]MCV8363859.1 hypothetical protein [Escherichia coli]MCV8429460.1 hypothetical protein [Escherichia coli]
MSIFKIHLDGNKKA